MYLTMHDTVVSGQKENCDRAFAATVERLRMLEADTVILIGDDHYTLFGPDCIPSILIGAGDVDGPVEPWLGAQREQIMTNEPLANHILQYGLDHGIDWAVAKALTVDHSIFVPWYYVVKRAPGVRTIPVYLNSGVAPLIRNQRCLQIGESIAAAVAEWKGQERVVVFASGGGAHWPGLGRWNDLNAEWDREILQMVEQGDVAGLVALTDDEIFKVGGNGGWELKNWICMMGALGHCRGITYTYEAVPELLGAFAYVHMQKSLVGLP
ncbi:protocatechuate 3,4-dioxygenase [Burkholderia sp. Bp9140]|nr:protocatechuate 3,4-dioxygenase [Burkholderia sp. Bp9140]